MGTIAKVTAGGSTHLIASTAYGTCPTASATADKIATIQGNQAFSLIVGETIHILFDWGNTADSPTLNVNSTGAKPIRAYSSIVPKGTMYWRKKSLVTLTYTTDVVSTGCWLMNDFNLPDPQAALMITYGDTTVDYNTFWDAITEGRDIIVKRTLSDGFQYKLYYRLTRYSTSTGADDGWFEFNCITGYSQNTINYECSWAEDEGWTEDDKYILVTTTDKVATTLTISGSSVTANKTYGQSIADGYSKSKDVIFSGSDGLKYEVVSTDWQNRQATLYAVDSTNSQIKIISVSSSTESSNMSGTLTTIPIGGSGGGSYVVEYGSSVDRSAVLDAIDNGSTIVVMIDEDPDFYFGYLSDYSTYNNALDTMQFTYIYRPSTLVHTNIIKYYWDYSNVSTNNGWSATSEYLPGFYPYLQATGNDTSQRTLTQNAITQIQLVSTGSIGFGTGLTISSGGIQVASAGVYKVSGSVKMRSATTGTTYGRKALITSGSSFSNSTEVTGAGANGSASLLDGVAIPAKLVSLSANDIVFLCAKSLDGEGLAEEHSVETYLLVERVASQGDTGISQAINYLPNADITSY